MTAIRKLLVANRGEIACRIMRTARRMGIATVAVYSDADVRALHVEQADEAVRLGPAPAAESYLRVDRVIDAARTTGADAIHPGYGFLAESAAFARACADAGLVYVGPPAEVIERLGLKGAAKLVAIDAGVPVLPGYNGADRDDAMLAREAEAIGFPLAVKAEAGGGGRGLRVVARPEALAEAIASARREAIGAFGDDRLILERWLDRPRHVEVQILGDTHGTVVHLHERDCSVQRRHQKVVEEAPAPGLPDTLRGRMTAAAVALARAVGYVNAGTVEFLVDGDAFFFLEVNTRLQVEHPVTEFVSNFDLVELQLRVASGEPLALRQEDIRAEGHAIEVRVCAEDPARGFLPQAGRILAMRWPEPGPDLDVRVDSGFRPGDDIGLAYDSLLGKIIVRGRDRDSARRALLDALGHTAIAGVVTNTPFLAAVVAHPSFAAGAPDTGFLGRAMAELVPSPRPADDAVLVAGALAAVLGRARGDRSPWSPGRPWRLNAPASETLRFLDGNDPRAVTITHGAFDFELAVDGRRHAAKASLAEDALALVLDGVARPFHVVRDGAMVWVMAGDGVHRLALLDPLAVSAGAEAADGHLRAPMPGRVVKVHVAPGAAVERGAPLIVLEAMKMEHTIAAPSAGRVASVPFAAGDLVQEGAELIVLEAEGA